MLASNSGHLQIQFGNFSREQWQTVAENTKARERFADCRVFPAPFPKRATPIGPSFIPCPELGPFLHISSEMKRQQPRAVLVLR